MFRIRNRSCRALAISGVLLLASLFTGPAAADLVAHYPLDGDATDISGNGHDGIAVNVVATADRFGTPGAALLFNGTSSAINTLLAREDYDPQFTVSAWIRYDGAPGDGFRPIVAGDAIGSVGPFFIGKDTGTTNIGVQNGPTAYNGSVAVGTSAWDGGWHHVAATFIAASPGSPLTCVVYVDGVIRGSGHFDSAAAAASSIYIGHEVEDPTVYFQGAIDDVRFYDQALSSAEIITLAGGTPVQNLVAHYPLDGDATDASGNGNHGVATSTTTTADRFGNPTGALLFNGVSSRISTPLARENYDPAFSLTAWFRYDGAIGDSYRPVIAADGPGTTGPFFVGKDTGNANIGIENGNYVPSVATGTDAWDGAWHHIAVTFDGPTAGGSLIGLLYLDGELVGTGTWNSAASAASILYIGHEVAGPTVYFLGAIDDVWFYDYALSAQEVLAIAGAPAVLPTLPSTGLAVLAGVLLAAGIRSARALTRARSARSEAAPTATS